MTQALDNITEKQGKRSISDSVAEKLVHAIDAPSIASATSDIQDDVGKDGKEPHRTTGEKIHKWGTYLGIDWIFNTVTGVGFSYAVNHTKLGQKYWSNPLKSGLNTALTPLIRDAGLRAGSVKAANTFIGIIAGGMFTIPPLMVLENNHIKRNISEAVDKMIHGRDAVENDPKFKEAYERIENAPKKDFTSGMASRFVALAPLLAIVTIPTTKRLIEKYWFKYVRNVSEYSFNKVGASEKKLFGHLAPKESQARWDTIHESAAMDFGLGVPYAILHSVFYNRFAGETTKEETPKKDESKPIAQASDKPEKEWSKSVEKKDRPVIAAAGKNYSERLSEAPSAERQMI